MRWMMVATGGLGLVLALGCSRLGTSVDALSPAVPGDAGSPANASGGAATAPGTPDAAEPEVAWLRAQPVEGQCDVTRSDRAGVLASFPGGCADLLVAQRPDGGGMLLAMPGHGVREWTAKGSRALPDLPKSGEQLGVDYVGYATDGRPVAMIATPLDPVMDEAAQKAWVEVDGKRTDVDFFAPMSPQLCTSHVLEGGAWKQMNRVPIEIFEGVESPMCPGSEGVVEVVGQDGSARSDYALGADPPEGGFDGLEPLQDDLASWHRVEGHDAAMGAFWFEGLRFTTPLALGKDGTWTLHDFGEVGAPMVLKGRQDVLIACAKGKAKVFKGGEELWSGVGPCPVFVP